MIKFLKNNKAQGYGFVTTMVIISILRQIEFILIDPKAHGENIFFFVVWWLIFSIPFYQYKQIKRNQASLLKILGIITLSVVTIIFDNYIRYPDNPISITLIVTFCLALVYVIQPTFFKKYKVYLIGFYILAIVYFTYIRLFSSNYEYYLNHEKGMALTFLVIPIPIVFVLWIYEQWKWLKTLQIEKTQAELALLKSQINPHFFFNTLNNLHALSIKNSKEAPGVILKLSGMMRYTIYEGKKDFVLIEDEIEYLKNYIDLHKIRFHKLVDVKFDHDVKQGDKVAPLCFIVLLENAFKHGAEKMTDAAYIHLSLKSNGTQITFDIENNFEHEDTIKTKGIGLVNLKRRLDLIYPKRYALNLNQSDDVYKVELKIDIND